ncbi:hypothetical protein [Hyalangium gracile]|uniref:hypothetical protein n=1 Tax=Hyalangium gracile TaxID=394092 RepID=UPI001CCD00EA|nr:hypothetical protein [Hyalangium gracile]
MMTKAAASVSMLLGAAALTLSSTAHAETCGWAPAGWNAPNGAAVFNKGPGPVDAVLTAVGEYRSHSMLSHGLTGVTHATMKMPTENAWPLLCGLPLNADQLRYGYPGLSQVGVGGIYTYLKGSTFLGYQRYNAAAADGIANAQWWNHAVIFGHSDTDPNAPVDFPVLNGGRVPYSLFQFRDLQGANLAAPWSTNNGMVCSTYLAHAHAYGGQGQISAYTYSHGQLAAAADSLFNNVNNDCRNEQGFWGGAALTFICPFFDVCANAAHQVANCMATNSCDRSEPHIWQGVRNDPVSVARSISPDRIGGWGVHWGTRDLNNVWAPDYNHNLQFNSGGAVYGCWH